MKRRFNASRDLLQKVLLAIVLGILVAFATYLFVGIKLKLDLPIVHKLCTPEVSIPVSDDIYSIAKTWENAKGYEPVQYVTMFDETETEEQFYTRMSDIDRSTLNHLLQKYPALLTNGISTLYFDVTQEVVSPLLDEETNTKLRADLLAGAVKTKEGHVILALDGMKSMLLIKVNLNHTDGYMALTYDKHKIKLSVTATAFEGWWGTMQEHLTQNSGSVVAIPANNYTYNSKAGYGVVAGGFIDNEIPRYKMSGNMDNYMGFNRDKEFRVGAEARYGCIDFTEGMGILLAHGEVPEVEIVSSLEQKQILDAMALYIQELGEDTEAEDYDSIPAIKGFIKSYDSNLIRAKVAWVLKNKTLLKAVKDGVLPEKIDDLEAYVAEKEKSVGVTKELQEVVNVVVLCEKYGASDYVKGNVPVHCAYNAIGQRESDAATVLFGIGGAKKADLRDLPGNGVTFADMQQLFLAYGISNAAVTTSGNRVGFGWKDKSLLHIQDTQDEGGRSYGAYLFY